MSMRRNKKARPVCVCGLLIAIQKKTDKIEFFSEGAKKMMQRVPIGHTKFIPDFLDYQKGVLKMKHSMTFPLSNAFDC